MNILDGTFAKGSERVMQLQVGANMDQNETIYVGTMTAVALFKGEQASDGGIINIADPVKANNAIGTLDSALTTINKQRADLGAYQNRFEMASQGVAIAAENLQAAESRIRDADMASEMVTFTRNSILSQAGTAMLAQANVQTQSVLQLLG
jgi:flagellin